MTPTQRQTDSRNLMRAIRKAMAGTERVQTRLNEFVKVIGKAMDVDVVSIYLLRPGDDLELCATRGLKKSAVHKTRMKPGEGLVGHVALSAHPLNLADATSHPSFSYRPEVGEDAFNSFLGVPVLRGGRTLGVLVVQTQDKRAFTDGEVEDLLTVALLLAEITIDDERTGGKRAPLKGIRLSSTQAETIKGVAFASGVADGNAHLHLPPIAPEKLLANDIPFEENRLEAAIKTLRTSVDALVSGETAQLSRASKEIYETYRLFAYDRKWLSRLREAVHAGLSAEGAVERVRNEHRARLNKARDPYLRARLHDLEDLANRMLRILSGEDLDAEKKNLPDKTILFARNLGPAELLDYDHDKISGLVFEEGAATSHTAIIAKAIGIPFVGRAKDILDRVEIGDEVLLDAESGDVHLRPVKKQIKAFDLRMRIRGEMDKAYKGLIDTPSVTKDGKRILLQLNAGLRIDLPQVKTVGADGIGLFRTEFQFMVSEFMPRLKDQTELYRAALDAAKDKPVIFRTLDLGGDKILPYIDALPEENPAIGWRAIRIALDRPGLLRYQIRALIAAGADRELKIMFPMVTTIEELIKARSLFEKEVERTQKMGLPMPHKIDIGVMLETPALAWHINAVCEYVDFVSVGANDLMQFFFAADRDNMRVSDRYDPLHPAFLSMMKYIADGCHRHNTPVSVCGEIAGRPLEACALIALGFDALSMAPTGIGPVKSAVLNLDREKLAALILPNIQTNSKFFTLREMLWKFCLSEGIPV